MDITELTTMLGTLLGVLAPLGGVGVWAYRKQNKRLKESEAKLAEISVEKAKYDATNDRINDLHSVIAVLNKTEVEQSQRISELNHALNVKEDEKRALKESSDNEIQDKKLQIRNLTEKALQSEHEVNRVNGLLNKAKDRITQLTEERDQERADKEYYKQWKCIKSQCNDPEGRRPPNSKLATQTFVDPEENRR